MSSKQMFLELKSRISINEITYFFLDEIQEIERWGKVINFIISDFDVDIYIMGSNSRKMSSEIASYLTGRYVLFRIYTLSFSEYLLFKFKYAKIDDSKK